MTRYDVDQLKPIIGDLIFAAFFDDEDFRKVARQLQHDLERLFPMDHKTPFAYALPALYSYFISAHHSTRAIELISEKVRKDFMKDLGIADLMMIQHSFMLEAVFHLRSAQAFFQLGPIKKRLGPPAREIDSIFAKNFPRLADARNALAHQDERALAIVDGVCAIEHLDVLQAVEKMQFISLNGPYLTVKDKSATDFVFEFPSKLILQTADEITRVLVKVT